MPISEKELVPEANQSKPEKRKTLHPRKRSVWLGLLVLAVVVVSAVLFYTGWVRHNRVTEQVDAAAEHEREAIPEVNVAKVVRASGDVSITFPGNITPLTEAYIYARASGYVKKRYVDIGDRVRQDQLLAEIDSPELDNQVMQARASLAQAEGQAAQSRAQLENQQAQLDLARVTWERYRNLQAKGAIARQDADQQETNFHTSEAAVRAAQSSVVAADDNVKAAQSNLDRLITMQDFEKVRAPFAGVITVRNFDIGALISAAGTSQATSFTQMGTTGASGELFRLAQYDILRILVNVDQENAPWIKAGQTGEVSVQELPSRKFTGRVSRTASSVDMTSRTMLTEVQMANPQLVLLPGMYGQVRLTRHSPEPALLAPGDSIVTTNHGLQVAVLLDPTEQHPPGAKRIHFTTVQVGRDNGEQIEVLSGLQGWEYVVINPGDAVQEGAVVKPVTSGAAKPGNRPNGKGSSPKQ